MHNQPARCPQCSFGWQDMSRKPSETRCQATAIAGHARGWIPQRCQIKARSDRTVAGPSARAAGDRASGLGRADRVDLAYSQCVNARHF
jgi:hypothetical protein